MVRGDVHATWSSLAALEHQRGVIDEGFQCACWT